jgi:co-chaperonin GroES (HSP10)
MLKQLTKFLFPSLLLVSVGALSAFAQDKTDFKVGDTIYVNAFSGTSLP